MIITFAWWEDFSKLVSESPIHCLAASVRATGSREKIVLLVNNAEALPDSYKQLLDNLAVQIVEIENFFHIVNTLKPSLGRFIFYEKACFLRWVFIDIYLKRFQPEAENIIVVDGDVIFFVSPELMREAFRGKNFVLQGCPAFTFLSNPFRWLESYKVNLDAFCADMDGFSARVSVNQMEKIKAAHQCGGWRLNAIGSDQDLINASIANGLLFQDDISYEQLRYRLAMCENALYLPTLIQGSNTRGPLLFKASLGAGPVTIQANASKITHLHLQYDCVRHFTGILHFAVNVNKGALRPRNGLFSSAVDSFRWVSDDPARISNVLSDQNASNALSYTGERLTRVALYKKIREIETQICYGLRTVGVRRSIIDEYFQVEPATFSLRDIYDPRTWWQTDVSMQWEEN